MLEHVLGNMLDRHVATGDFIAHAGEPVDYWIGVVHGFVKMSVGNSDGRISTLAGVSAGLWFGEGSLLKHEPRRYDVLALRPSHVALMPRRTFEWLRRTSIPFNHYLQDLLNARLSHFIGTLERERLLDTDARMAHCIASLLDESLCPHAPGLLQIGQAELALLANMSRQRANVALHRLQALQLIRIERLGLRVLDMAGLRLHWPSAKPLGGGAPRQQWRPASSDSSSPARGIAPSS
ncbi:Crp/Fnr family transcriptional regulator [Variovorax sp. OV329]|uniref:Crp/Fnr family transcriptional regulator n=1 Tax=Variovorax sp. OV329 TaxID=1882825 RepID=UPI0008EED6C0|nr:Crp/Fnr family transcriptional regulator [Variovorax sp. OV329]SFL87953.1 cAMP-binding domain of CRP or a regulatory subunit of cAMP-dependent protein kinases [Variovorax sp. OV329]